MRGEGSLSRQSGTYLSESPHASNPRPQGSDRYSSLLFLLFPLLRRWKKTLLTSVVVEYIRIHKYLARRLCKRQAGTQTSCSASPVLLLASHPGFRCKHTFHFRLLRLESYGLSHGILPCTGLDRALPLSRSSKIGHRYR